MAVEALECPTLLYNGFGEHNIQGIGDKHIPLIHNVMNTDVVTAISDRSTDALDVEDQPQGGTLDSNMLIYEIGGGYQIGGWKEGQTIDLMVGLRGLHLENDLEVYGQGKYSSEADVLDPMVVVRPSVPLFPSKINGLRFNGILAIGGGGDSELIYEMQPQLQYQFHKNFAARIGYRRIGWKFEGHGNDNELNLSLAGLVLGVGARF